MTREEAIKILQGAIKKPNTKDGYLGQAIDMAIQALSQEPCDDAISREAVLSLFDKSTFASWDLTLLEHRIKALPPVTQKSGKCKDCKYFEYDSVAKVDGIPLIVAHEICNKWGDGCKTSEDGYCYLYEPQESEVRNETDN